MYQISLVLSFLMSSPNHNSYPATTPHCQPRPLSLQLNMNQVSSSATSSANKTNATRKRSLNYEPEVICFSDICIIHLILIWCFQSSLQIIITFVSRLRPWSQTQDPYEKFDLDRCPHQ